MEITNNQIYELLKETVAANTKTTEELKQAIRSTRNEILEELKSVKDENLALREENTKLKERLINTERKIRKFNLVVYGVKEEQDEIGDINNFLNILDTHLDIKANFNDLRDFHRIGKAKENINRPVLVELLSYKLKTEIYAKVKKLKGTGIFVSEDYSPEDYAIQKKLRIYLKKARENGQQAFMRNNLLIIEGSSYTVEDLEEQNYLEGKVNEEEDKEVLEVVENRNINTKRNIGMDEKYKIGEKEKEKKITKESTTKRGEPQGVAASTRRTTRIKSISQI
ncbi:unnamed protein product [Phaedon cochleariae]|uniref:Endonuclease-reverse transcriptase n=1 Tax=Phaedon cochleariae TaxID=80249 RepID=A0A9N9WYD2_PHACE|nr:unnamed protein product [Phaedon cochleariae]